MRVAKHGEFRLKTKGSHDLLMRKGTSVILDSTPSDSLLLIWIYLLLDLRLQLVRVDTTSALLAFSQVKNSILFANT